MTGILQKCQNHESQRIMKVKIMEVVQCGEDCRVLILDQNKHISVTSGNSLVRSVDVLKYCINVNLLVLMIMIM